jgi:hypothetical protein
MTDIVERLRAGPNGKHDPAIYGEMLAAAAEIERLRALQSMAIEVIDASDEMTAENERLRAALTRINQIVRKRTEPHMRAYTHFMRDFDEVRALCGKILNQQPRRAALDELTAETERLGLYDPPKEG